MAPYISNLKEADYEEVPQTSRGSQEDVNLINTHVKRSCLSHPLTFIFGLTMVVLLCSASLNIFLSQKVRMLQRLSCTSPFEAGYDTEWGKLFSSILHEGK